MSENGAPSRPQPRIKAKAWDPSLEEQVLERWKGSGLYEPDHSRPYYTIDTPPPYPSGRPWHIGAAAHYSQIDMIARAARMAGKNVYFPVGIDRNGLPVELYTEKKHKIRMKETPREEFIALCKESLDELEGEMVQIMARLGISADIGSRYRTDSEEYRALTQSTFIDLWRRGLIYLANRPNNYDWASGTTIADAEIAYAEVPTKLVHMRFQVPDAGAEIIIASTRPELLCACQTIIVSKGDERYSNLVGKEAVLPLFERKVAIQTHRSVDPEFGSGAVMVCSYGDQNDVALFRELRLEEIVAIGLDGKMTESAGPYAALRPKQARQKITEDLEAAGLVEKIDEIMHRTPVSERSKNPIEIVPMEEYYLRQTGSLGRVRELGDSVQFYPEMHRQILNNWIGSVSIDWPISRRRYYGTEIPVWRCKECSEPHVPEPGAYCRPWAEPCPAEKCAKCGCRTFEGEQRTFDTWMDSSISPLFVSRYGQDAQFFARAYPAALRPQAKDIVRTWLYYTLLRCDQLTGKPAWSEAWIMGYGLDERGAKMSKSKGNALDPMPVIERIGADTFRFWSACEVSHGSDFRCSEQKMDSTKKFLSKLWNISRFLSSFEPVAQADLQPPDEWILAELDSLISECNKGYDAYNFFVPAIAVREFTWNVFAAHYVEMAKARAYGEGFSADERDAAVFTLHTVLRALLKLLAPITPFIADYLWQELYSGDSVHAQAREEPQGTKRDESLAKRIFDFNSAVWNEKKRRGLSLKDGIGVPVPAELAGFARDLSAMHNLNGA